MTTIQSPSHALGLMVMGAYSEIMKYMPEALVSTDGPKKIYPLIIGLEGMMYSFTDKMYFHQLNDDGTTTVKKYKEVKMELVKRKKELRFGNASHNEQWLDLFHEYLILLSSCFNQIGLAPLKMTDDIDWDEQPFIPPEHEQDTESPDPTILN